MNTKYPLRALVVDDDEIIRQATVRALRQEGFLCEVASNGMRAIEKLNESVFDIAICDLRMPEMNGHTLALEILAMNWRPAIIVLTGVLEPRLAQDLLAHGVDDVIAKPANYDFLVLKARALGERRRLLRPADMDTDERETQGDSFEVGTKNCLRSGALHNESLGQPETSDRRLIEITSDLVELGREVTIACEPIDESYCGPAFEEADALTLEREQVIASADVLRPAVETKSPEISKSGVETPEHQKTEYLKLVHIQVGMILQQDILLRDGRLLVGRGTELNPCLLDRIREFAAGVGVIEPISVEVRTAGKCRPVTS